MANDFFQRLDAATDYEKLVRGVYGDCKRVIDELWLKNPQNDTPADKFSINALDGRWKDHKTGDGGAFISLIRATHPDTWRAEWSRAVPAAAAVFGKVTKTPDKPSDAAPSGSDASSGDDEPHEGKKKQSFSEIMEKGRKRQNVNDYNEFVEGYKVTNVFLQECGLWTNSGGRLGKDTRLCFPCTDPLTGELTGIKMRCMKPVLQAVGSDKKLKSKNMGGSKAGIIGWESVARQPTLPVLLVEGEKDWIVTAFDLLGKFAVITNSNGAGTWKSEWSKALTGRDVYVLYDEDEAGNSGGRRASASLVIHAKSVRIAHLGTGDKDIFDWIRGDGPGLTALLAVIERAEIYDPKANPGEIDAFIRTNCQDEEAEPNVIADMLFKCLTDNGAMFNQVDDREAFCAWRGKVYSAGPSDPWWQSLVYSYTGKDAGSSEGYRLLKHIEMLCITKGKPVEATTWFAKRGDSLYLPLYGQEQKMAEVTQRDISVVPNGYNDVVLMPVNNVKEVDYLDDRHYEPEKGERAWEQMIGMLNCAPMFRQLVSAAVLALPFYDWSETHPLLRFQGSTGSGKSFATKIITTLLYGQPENQGGDTMASLYRMAGSRILLALDNLEDTNLARDPETRDLLLRAASGTTRAKSAKDSERAVVAQRVNCWIMSTGKSPIGVGYEDMEERLVVVPMGGYAQQGFGGTDQIRWVQANRTLLYSYFLRQTRRILHALQRGQQRAIMRGFSTDQRPRLQEWYAILGIAAGDMDRPSDTTTTWLSSAYEGEKSSVIESDPVIALLMRAPAFLKDSQTRGFEMVEHHDNGAVFDMSCHTQVLHALLSRIARDVGLPYRIPSPKSLGYHLRSLSRRAGEFGFTLEQRETQTRMVGTGVRNRAWYIAIHLDAIRALVSFTSTTSNGESLGLQSEASEIPREPGSDDSVFEGTAPSPSGLSFTDDDGRERF